MKRAKSVQKEATTQKFTKANDSTKLSVEKIDAVTVTSANIWKKWLDKNHLKKEKVNFISYKKHTNKGKFNSIQFNC
jgi:predicted transcriptional regulator YdeE